MTLPRVPAARPLGNISGERLHIAELGKIARKRVALLGAVGNGV